MAISDHPVTPWGKVLEAERHLRGWSHEETIKRAGLKSPSTWNTVVYGGREDRGEFTVVTPRPDTLARLALALGLDVLKVLKKAGHTKLPDDAQIDYHLEVVPSAQLWGELRQRGELTKGMEGVLARRKSPASAPNTTGYPDQ